MQYKIQENELIPDTTNEQMLSFSAVGLSSVSSRLNGNHSHLDFTDSPSRRLTEVTT